jgi:hypothetical protein
MCILNDSCVAEVHSEGVTNPAKLLLDVVRALACFVQEDTCPDLQRVSGIFAEVFVANPWAYLLDRLSNESGYSACCQVH